MLDNGVPIVARGRWAAPTLVRLSSSRAGLPEGETIDLTANVQAVRPGGETPTGRVTFFVGGHPLGSATMEADGRAHLRGVRLPSGVHPLTASYDGDSRHAGASSAPLPQVVVAPAAPVLVAVAAPTRTPEGVRLEAELLDAGTGRLVDSATGVLLFVVAGERLAQAPLVDGHASVVVDRLPGGALRVVFPGDDEHAAASAHLRLVSGS